MKADLHVHSNHSTDGAASVRRLLVEAKKKGLDAFAVTDHNSCASMEDIASLCGPDGKADGILLISGTEISTDAGHILGLFLKQPVAFDRMRMERGVYSLEEAVTEIHQAGGITSAAHPFQTLVANDKLYASIALLDAIETFNARTPSKNIHANPQAARFASASGRPSTAGSDAHLPGELGDGYLETELSELTADALKAAILQGRVNARGRQSLQVYQGLSQLVKKYREKSYRSLPKRAAVTAFFLAKDALRGLHLLKKDKGQ